ncbi:enoyl-CoA hydratase [Aurantiacibacter zhengii]|uniref:Enoyl-CoA hydratase n=1 Tax=Aurantiacibacter zhengii TaxID=2307003 RepID=A0A418NUY4_9SPHN|nr:enoyl-CoA hydratase [Aurantiacibacter zhengii]
MHVPDQEIQLRETPGCLEIRINRPDRKNALTLAMYRTMIDALERASASDDIRVVLFTGEGEAFCAGNDLKDFLAVADTGATEAINFIRAVATFDKPLVAAVHGACIGVGTTMLFHFDLVYAADDAQFVMPFVNLGLVPEGGSSLAAPAIFGRAKAAELLMLGEPLSAEDGEASGFVTRVMPVAEVQDYARSRVDDLLQRPPQALAKTRNLLADNREAMLAQIEVEAEVFAGALKGAEVQQAIAAFFARRK